MEFEANIRDYYSTPDDPAGDNCHECGRGFALDDLGDKHGVLLCDGCSEKYDNLAALEAIADQEQDEMAARRRRHALAIVDDESEEERPWD